MKIYSFSQTADDSLNWSAVLITGQEPYYIEFYGGAGFHPKPISDCPAISGAVKKDFFSKGHLFPTEINWWSGSRVFSRRIWLEVKDLLVDNRQQELFYDLKHTFMCVEPLYAFDDEGRQEEKERPDLNKVETWLKPEIHYFKLKPDAFSTHYVTEKFKERLESAGYEGFEFTECES